MWEAPKRRRLRRLGSPKLGGVPRPVARVMAAALSEDPGARPKDGAFLALGASLRSPAGRSPPSPATSLRILSERCSSCSGLAVAGFATWRIWERQIPGGRPTVAVADFVNETGEKELDSISGLLITSLEQGTQLRVLTRGRMVDVLKQLGKGAVERIDEPLAREVGRETRAKALLLASIRKLGDAYVVEMRALDPLHDEYIFTVSDRATGKGAVFDLVDRLGAATRKRLGTPDAAVAPPPKVASITTDNPKAWELLVPVAAGHGPDGRLAEARRLAQEAVKEDPEFALAYHQLALAACLARVAKPDPDRAPGLKEVEAAEARADRLPEKERLTLRAASGARRQAAVGCRASFRGGRRGLPTRQGRPLRRPARSSTTGREPGDSRSSTSSACSSSTRPTSTRSITCSTRSGGRASLRGSCRSSSSAPPRPSGTTRPS